MRRTSRRTSADKQAAFNAREQERLRSELRDFAVREAKKALADTLKDLERDMTYSARQSIGSPSRNRYGVDAQSFNGFDISSFGSSFFGFMTRIFANSTRTRIEDSSATETLRSSSENQLYLESRSQKEAALALGARKAQRNV